MRNFAMCIQMTVYIMGELTMHEIQKDEGNNQADMSMRIQILGKYTEWGFDKVNMYFGSLKTQ